MATTLRLLSQKGLHFLRYKHFRQWSRKNPAKFDSANLKPAIGLLIAGSALYTARNHFLGMVQAAKSRKHVEDQKNVQLTMREKRFLKFASVAYDGQIYMTPQDFLDSIVENEPRTRMKRRILTIREIELMHNAIPPLAKGNIHMFRSLRDKGIISFTEYLFLLSILTKPQSGFRIAFKMFDTDGNDRVDKSEFLVMEKIFSHTWRGRHGEESNDTNLELVRDKTPEDVCRHYIDDDQGLQRRHAVDTTLMIHFFGKDGTDELDYENFQHFMQHLQHEVLELEFYEFSKGLDVITDIDFAKILLRYTHLNASEYEEYLDRLITSTEESHEIKFAEYLIFYQFLNSLEDFAMAMRMYTLADRPISKDEFLRAVKVCTGTTVSNHIVDTVFTLFDVDGDGRLSYREFIAIMKDRLHRGLKSQSKEETWEFFKFCMKQEMKSQ